jgi:hypothetical protein
MTLCIIDSSLNAQFQHGRSCRIGVGTEHAPVHPAFNRPTLLNNCLILAIGSLTQIQELMEVEGCIYKAIADYPMSLQDRHSSLRMLSIVVLDEVFIGHSFFLFHKYRSFHDLSEASRIRISCLKGFGHHVGQLKLPWGLR